MTENEICPVVPYYEHKKFFFLFHTVKRTALKTLKITPGPLKEMAQIQLDECLKRYIIHDVSP